jgi:hypothetical protein
MALVTTHYGPRFYLYDLSSSSPQIVKERQMEFDVESDPDTLFELFGDDSRSFTE